MGRHCWRRRFIRPLRGSSARRCELPEEAALITLAVVLGSLLIVALAELLRPRRRREFPALRRRLGNLGIWLLNVVLAAFVFASPAVFRPQLEAAFGLTLPAWPIGNVAVGFVAGFLLLDLLQYAMHRCQHAVPFLWRLHALHHSDPDVDVTTSVRHHPIEYLIATGIYWLAALALGIPALVVTSHAVTVFAAASITHGNTRLPEWLERWLQPVFITLDLHLVHHSVSPAEANANFGAVFSIWDRLFGTYTRLSRTDLDRLVFGVRELPRRDAVKPPAMLLTPWLLRRADQARRAASISSAV
jgi:sterol desaturase/sphingolipid hydroxylase (fatty acid hydroxylase superfamily)